MSKLRKVFIHSEKELEQAIKNGHEVLQREIKCTDGCSSCIIYHYMVLAE